MLMPVVAAMAIAWGGWWVLSVPVLIFGLIPVLDAACGHERGNPIEGTPPRAGLRPDLSLWAWVPTQVVMIGAAVARIMSCSSGRRVWARRRWRKLYHGSLVSVSGRLRGL